MPLSRSYKCEKGLKKIFLTVSGVMPFKSGCLLWQVGKQYSYKKNVLEIHYHYFRIRKPNNENFHIAATSLSKYFLMIILNKCWTTKIIHRHSNIEGYPNSRVLIIIDEAKFKYPIFMKNNIWTIHTLLLSPIKLLSSISKSDVMSTLGLFECFTSNDCDLCNALVGVGSSNF